MTNKDLANLIFPEVKHDINYYEEKYPKRNLKEGEVVTRVAPSPTGYMHLGTLFQAIIDYILVKNRGGVFYLRNEDTDTKREIEGAVKLVIDTLKEYEIMPDEYEVEGKVVGEYGPYRQTERKEIYHTFIKHLIEKGEAYPCFCTKEELAEMRSTQEKSKIRTGYYGKWAKCRNLTIEEQAEKIKAGTPYVIRFKSHGDFDKKFIFEDLVKGKLELSLNDEDFIIMKSSDQLPTYHFAHLVDDHLMGTTHVIRGEEWLPSVAKHIELFRAFGFKPPKYIHTPLIIKKEGNTVRKLSKRKDPEASMSYYKECGYPKKAVIESLMTIINSNYEEWHKANPNSTYLEFKYSPKKMSASGALYDLDKLKNISKNIISKMTKEELMQESLTWANSYSEKLKKLIERDKEYYMNILNIEREQKKPRKDIAKYDEIIENIWYMYDDLYEEKEKVYEWQKITDPKEIQTITTTYMDKYFTTSDKELWFNGVKELSEDLGYASNMKDYKEHPENYKGSVADVSTVLRVALTSKSTTPDLYEIMSLLGKERITKRYTSLAK
ncbi:MAG: glutamate--tRNA ligase [Bacilli bacterium]|nr:glutamate--tRNA ligase [Bacilli bacterium]